MRQHTVSLGSTNPALLLPSNDATLPEDDEDAHSIYMKPWTAILEGGKRGHDVRIDAMA